MNILIVDDTQFIRQIVCKIINDSGHCAISAKDHTQAFLAFKEHDVDLVLMDIEMPEMDGFELTRQIRKRHKEWIPIIFLSSNDSEQYLTKGIDVGGDDYLTKPVKEVILIAKIRAMERIALMKGELDRANKQLALLSNIDSLTQVLNRRGLEQMLIKAWQTNLRLKGELSVLMIDIDHFKEYNDHYGHIKGDECLLDVAQLISQTLNRSTDFIARYGGEEFVVVLPFTPVDGARFKAAEILKRLVERKIKHEFSTCSPFISVSVGISVCRGDIDNVHELIKQADKALYFAKESGRNQYQVFDSKQEY